MGISYKDAGVDITAGNEAVEKMKNHVKRTFRPEVLTDIGGFAGLFALDIKKYPDPVLISGTDGVGTKLRVAMLTDRHDTIGIDAVAMCANDILVQGAEPLFFLDYLAVGKLSPDKVADIVKGVSEGCLQAGCALIGGETAEMPGFYADDEYDIAGFCVGVANRDKIITGAGIVPGDTIIGLPSTGLHSNGYSLARKVLLDHARLGVDDFVPELDQTLGSALLTPTRIYVKDILPLLEKFRIKGMCHITGGGLVENLPRIFPSGTSGEINLSAWETPAIFKLIQKLGEVDQHEMYRVFNMGIGFCLVINAAVVDEVVSSCPGATVIGKIVEGTGQVIFTGEAK